MEDFKAVYSKWELEKVPGELMWYMEANGIEDVRIVAKKSKSSRSVAQLRYYFGVMIPKFLEAPKFDWWEPMDVHNWIKAEYMMDQDSLIETAIDFYIWSIGTTEFVLLVAGMFDEASTKEKDTKEFEERLAHIRADASTRFWIYIPQPNEPPLNDYISNKDSRRVAEVLLDPGDPGDEDSTVQG